MKILSWNIKWGCGCDGIVSLPRIAGVIRGVGDCDVICLQEVAINHPGLRGSQGEDQVALLQDAFPGYSAHYGIASDLPSETTSRRQFGNLVLSRLPVMQVFRHSLPFPAEHGALGMPRIALEVVVAAGEMQLRVTTAHLEYYSRVQRKAQVRQLRAIHMEALSQAANKSDTRDLDPPFQGPFRPVSSIYCGDFNCEPGAAELAYLTESAGNDASRLIDAWSIANPDTPNAFTVGLNVCSWPDRAYCCDYFFVSPDLRGCVRQVTVNQDTDASDHQPILLELAVAN
ncbi:endonuclease/exonuclease/phosphatase family protein [Dechloromonas sp. XY25]|uniref:Endonuclease/exonuclease/phosphatase family protein n=1 Tax=Dechloromonas hankyongensis TaxID=2908002 RepID=A0ABS9K4G4_9RHOO|nr:endonuclease/exonuclease/phosphatase family protein [Dechloromonas hankyongensis]MCG2578057.1 endonuclease/exonuclease/phosphatase family protein [Dechloromonas hankyongensis]